MVFGALLGGAVTRAGERFQEAAERQRRTEDWQRQNALGLQVEFLTKNYGNMTPEQQEAALGGIAPLIGMKPKELSPLVGGMRSIHSVLPPQYMDAEAMGASRSAKGSLEVTPSKEAPLRTVGRTPLPAKMIEEGGWEAPSSIQIGQIPQPADIGTSSIYAPTTGHTASLPSQTPNELLAQRKFEQDKAIRHQQLIEIDAVPDELMGPDLKEASRAKVVGGISAVPVVTSKIGAGSRERIAADKANQFQSSGRLVIRNGIPLPVRGTGNDEFILDPEKGWIPLVPQAGDEVYEKPTPLGTVQGAADVYSLERSGQQKGAVTPLKVGVRPRASASGGATASRSFRDEMALRKDFENHPIVKNADETARQVKLAEGALAGGSTNFVAIDQALINVFNKMIDPNSVVREGEYARTIENTPLLNRIKGKMAAIQAGGAGLTTEERTALVTISKRFAADSKAAFGARANEFSRMAKERGFNPKNVVVPRSGEAQVPSGSWDNQKEARYQELLRKRGGK